MRQRSRCAVGVGCFHGTVDGMGEPDRLKALLRAWERDGAQPFTGVWAALWAGIRRVPSEEPKRWHRLLAVHALLLGATYVMFGWVGAVLITLTPVVTLIAVLYLAVTLMNVYLLVFGPPEDPGRPR